MSAAKRAREGRARESVSNAPAARVRVLCISGPNLGLLGKREPGVYGTETLAAIHTRLKARGRELGVDVTTKQSNHEGDLVDWIGEAPGRYAGLLLNAGAYTHTSIAILDALRSAALPCVEVHLSNPEAREPYRRRSRLAPACIARVSGFKGDSYILALDGLARVLTQGTA